MTRKRVLTWLILCVVSPQAFAGADWKIDYQLAHFEGYEGVSRKGFQNNFEGHAPKGQRQNLYGESELRLKASRETLSLHLFARQDILIKTNRDTMDLYAALQQNRPVERNRNYLIDLEANGNRRQGVGIGWSLPSHLVAPTRFDGLELRADVYQIARYQTGVLNGSVQSDANGDYAVELFGSRSDSRKQFQFPERPGDFSGIGVSLSVGGKMSVGTAGQLHFRVDDFLNFNRLRNLPVQAGDATTNVQSTDPSGFDTARAAILLKNRYDNQSPVLKTRLSVRYDHTLTGLPQTTFSAGIRTYGSFAMPMIAVVHLASDICGCRVGVESNLYYRSLGPVLEVGRFRASIQTDSLSSANRSAIGAQLTYWHPL